MQELIKFEDSKLYEAIKEKQNLEEEYFLRKDKLKKEMQKLRKERMDYLLNLQRQLNIQKDDILERIKKKERERDDAKSKLCNKIGHAFDTTYEILDYIPFEFNHSNRHGEECIVKYISKCKFCGSKVEGTSRQYSKYVVHQASTPLKEEHLLLLEEQKQDFEFFNLYAELEELDKNINLIKKELRKLCKHFGCIRSKSSYTCECCGENWDNHYEIL